MFTLDPNSRSANLSEVNKIEALIGHCTCAAWKNSWLTAALCRWIGGS